MKRLAHSVALLLALVAVGSPELAQADRGQKQSGLRAPGMNRPAGTRMKDHLDPIAKRRIETRHTERSHLLSQKSLGATPYTVAGFQPVVGERDPKGNYVNRAFVEQNMKDRYQFVVKLRGTLEETKGERNLAKHDAAKASDGSWSSWRVKQRYETLDKKVGELTQQLVDATRQYDTLRTQLRANPRIQWFHF